MPAGTDERAIALLLDFENAQDADIHRLLAEAAAFGRVIVRRAYADWNRHAAAQGPLREAGFEAVHQFTSGSRGKNSTDIHLTVDAMDILYTRPVDTFVLVTADSDFATLARRLREGGKRVVGMGSRQRAGRSLVQSCDQYIYYDQPMPVQTERREPQRAASKAAPKADVTDLHHIVMEAIAAASDDGESVYGGPLHERIRRIRPDFNYRDYGFSSFLRFVESLKPVIRIGRSDDVSDFVVTIDPEYEDQVRGPRAPHGGGGGGASGRPILSKDIQERIDEQWAHSARNGRLSGRRAATVVAEMYGVSRLGDTPLEDLAGVLACAPLLGERWKKDGPNLVRKP